MRTIDKINYYLTKENKNGADLCEYLGVSSGVYSQWNTGRTHPRKSKLPIIAEYLGVEVSDIQGDDTNKKEKPTAQGGELTEKDVALINMKPLTEEQKQQAMDIAKRIDICVKESGMKKTEFYEKSGISSANFNYWSHGTNYPRQKKLADAAKCLNVSVRYLEYGDEQTKKPTAQSDGLISSLPQDVQEIISLCQKNPRLASALLNLAHQLQNRSSDPA